MGRRIFVTGGAGFVGHRFLERLRASAVDVVALDRSGKLNNHGHSRLQIVSGNLDDASTYRAALASCDTVVHLAAATGNASKDEHHRVNAEGTARLVHEAKQAGVSNFLFVSSIAVAFGDITGYPYAQAKRLAEDSVRGSGLNFLIARPTMILGPGAPILKSLSMLACLPIAVLPGNGRARVQPVHVEDVAACLLCAVETASFRNETVTIAGSEALSIEALLRRIRASRRASTGPLIHLPLPLLQVPLRLAETLGLGAMLPVTAGQLSSFRFDAVGTPNFLQDACSPSCSLESMLVVAAAVAPPIEDAAVLDAECNLFTRHVVALDANDYIRSKYRDAHQRIPGLTAGDGFDASLVRFARRGKLRLAFADSYAAMFARASTLRKKLILLLAILETCPPSFRTLDAPVGGSPLGALIGLCLTGIAALSGIVIGAVVLLPVRATLAIVQRGKP